MYDNSFARGTAILLCVQMLCHADRLMHQEKQTSALSTLGFIHERNYISLRALKPPCAARL